MRNSRLLTCLAVLTLAGCNRATPSRPSTQAVTAIILPQPQQIIKGWGCYPCTYKMDRGNPQNYNIFSRPHAQRLLLKELGISFMRCNILPESYDARQDDGSLNTRYLDATLVRHLKMARHYGMTKYLLTVWSPPAIFKDPPILAGWDRKTHRPAQLRPERESDYCCYVVKTLDYLTKQQGLAKPIAYSIQNEPGAAVPLWDGTVYDARQWQRVCKMMRRALDAGGYRDVPLIGPEAATYTDSVAFVGGPDAPALKSDKVLAQALAGFAYHGYAATSQNAPGPQKLRSAAQVAHSLGKDVWMTEWCVMGRPLAPLDHSLEVMQRFAREMTYIPTNYWTWWQGWWFSYPKNETLLTGTDDNHLHISKTYRILQRLWHSAPPGGVVKLVQTSDPEIKGFDPFKVQTVAFDYHNHMTVLFVNPGDQKKLLTVKGLHGQGATAYLSTANDDMVKQSVSPLLHGTITVTLPPRSIIVLATRSGV